MPARESRVKNQFPSELRKIRKKARLNQHQLIERCGELAKSEPEKYSTVTLSTISLLENGYTRPRPRTAETLAAALSIDVNKLFPSGTDDFVRNVEGGRKRAPGKNKGGRPRKSPQSKKL